MLWLIAALGTCIGIAAGLLGAGASIFTVLLFIHVVGLDLTTAVITSLAVVAVMCVVGLIPYARAGAVMWKAGVGFSLASMTGAYLGGRISGLIPTKALMAIFVLAMIAAAAAMLLKRPLPANVETRPSRQHVPAVAVGGLLLGTLTGTVGLGGGFAVVPLLVILVHTPMRLAVGTSLLVIEMNTLAGLAGHLPHLAAIDWRLASCVAIAASVGSLAGAKVGKRMNAGTLRRAFGILMLVGAIAQLASSLLG
ncbi:MAG: hypothetical protein JWP87_4961 [Labilithrix sp.]|nr:hypothetical protein [Labilithrix sp.]